MPGSVIFLRMPRCGSASLKQFCLNYGFYSYGGHDLDFLGKSLPQKLRSRLLLSLYPDESFTKRICRRIGTYSYLSAYKFTCVRNPFSRAVSIFNHASWGNVDSFEDFCERLYKQRFPNSCAKWHSIVISNHVTLKGQYAINNFLKLEQISQDLAKLKNDIGLEVDSSKLKHVDNSADSSKPKICFKEYYSKRSEEIILDTYREDFLNFGYNFKL